LFCFVVFGGSKRYAKQSGVAQGCVALGRPRAVGEPRKELCSASAAAAGAERVLCGAFEEGAGLGKSGEEGAFVLHTLALSGMAAAAGGAAAGGGGGSGGSHRRTGSSSGRGGGGGMSTMSLRAESLEMRENWLVALACGTCCDDLGNDGHAAPGDGVSVGCTALMAAAAAGDTRRLAELCSDLEVRRSLLPAAD
jgi:hypothetical protein